MAAASLQKGISIAAAGAGRLVATGGSRTAADRLELGRRPAALGAQRYDWADTLRPPVLLDGAAEAAQLAGAAFPRPLGPRTVLAARVRTVATALAARASDPRWDPAPAAGSLLALAAALELARTR